MKTRDEWLIHLSEAVVKEDWPLLSKYNRIDASPNIEPYNVAVYVSFGFPPELNTSLFAVSRSAGLMAHNLEE